MSSRSYIVVIALGGVTDSVDATVQRAIGDGVAVLLVTDSHKEAMARDRMAAVIEAGALTVQPVRIRTIRWLRNWVRETGNKLVRLIETTVYRVFRFAGHRLWLSKRAASAVIKLGNRVSAATGRAGRGLMSRVVDPVVLVSGMAATKPREVFGITQIVSRLISSNLVVAVICLDSSSLLAGWAIGKSHRGLPVLTEYPVDWSQRVVTQMELLAGGSTQ